MDPVNQLVALLQLSAPFTAPIHQVMNAGGPLAALEGDQLAKSRLGAEVGQLMIKTGVERVVFRGNGLRHNVPLRTPTPILPDFPNERQIT